MGDSEGIVNRLVPVAACSPHPGNYNRHDQAQIEDLRLSLRRFGQVRSLVVQACSEQGVAASSEGPEAGDGDAGYLLVAGHGVHEAARLEGIEQVRADVIPAGWSPARVLAYLVADNELARRGMPDEAQLTALVQQIEAEADAELARLAAGGEARLAEILVGLETEIYGQTSTDRDGQGVSSTWDQVQSATVGRVIIDDIETRLAEHVVELLKNALIRQFEQNDRPIHETLEAIIIAGVGAVEAGDS